MSDYNNQIVVIGESVRTASRQFSRVIPKDSDIKWATEKVFVMDILRKSKDLRAAMPETQVSAILQAGSMGLTLNPSAGECYLIPRKMKRDDKDSPIIAYASPSYRGLIKTAVDSGAILYGVAEVVHKNDHFEYFGKTKPPIHVVDVMKERGEPVGVYTLAKLPSGDVVPTWMDKERILKAKAMSDNPNGLMWKEFWQEGWCKTALRTAQKTWPRSKQLNTTIGILNEHEGINFDTKKPENLDTEEKVELLISEDQLIVLNDLVKEAAELQKCQLDRIMEMTVSVFNVDKLGNLPERLYKSCFGRLESYVDQLKIKQRASRNGKL